MATSGQIRTQLGNTVARLERQVTRGNARPTPGEAADIPEIRKFIVNLTSDITAANKSLAIMTTLQNKWVNLIEQMDDNEERKNEQNLYTEWFEEQGGQNLSARIMEAEDSIDENVARTDEAKERIENQQEQHGLRQEQHQQRHQEPFQLQVKLPTLNLPRFNNGIEEFHQFWNRFEVAIHLKNMANVDKLLHLKSCLHGEAAKAISGFLDTNANYDAAVETLKKKYGDIEFLKKTLHRRLRQRFDTSTTKGTRLMVDDFECTCKQLENLQINTNTTEVENDLEEKLPEWMLKDVITEQTRTDQWDANALRRTVEKLLKIEEATERVRQMNLMNSNDTVRRNTNERRQRIVATPPVPATACAFCQQEHPSEDCKNFFTQEQRENATKEKNLCLKCLQQGHRAAACRTRINCQRCNFRHHTAICKGKAANQRIQTNTTALCTATANKFGNGTMYTLNTFISNPEQPNKQYKALAFCDSGSNFSYIKSNMAERMNLATKKNITMTVNTFESDESRNRTCEEKLITLHLKDGKRLNMKVLTSEKFVNTMKTAQVPKNWQRYGKNLKPRFKEAEPDILIGADYLDEVIKPANAHRIDNNLTIIESEAGPIVRIVTQPETTMKESMVSLAIAQQKDETPKLWELETIGIHDVPTNDVAEVKRHFDETFCKDNDGRATVSWPFCDLNGIKPDLGLCVKRLESVYASMKKNGILEEYDEIIQAQLRDNVITEFDPTQEPAKHYLPHHAVINEEKETTKVRGVLDASAKTKDGKALNECIFSGKPPLNSLAKILLYVRCSNIVVSSDVQSAFLTINLAEESQKFCCFIWLKNIYKPPTKENLRHLRWKRMPFGINASPILLKLVIERHLDDWAKTHPEDSLTAEEIKTKIYVDNVIQCSTTPEEALAKAKTAKIIFEAAKMNLRKFRSSDTNVDKQLAGQFADGKLLGITWSKSDEFIIGWTNDTSKTPQNKRELLAFAAKPFDTAQLLSPAILPLKRLIQRLWMEKKSWNEQFSKETKEEVTNLWQERTKKCLQFPRKLFTILENAEYNLHVFADSSGKAYGVAAYITQITTDTISRSIVFAKSRLAPLKPLLTIPRLELTAVALAGNVAEFIETTIPFKIKSTYIWTDSTTVLHWLKRDNGNDRFVNNRIVKLRNKRWIFKYVPTKENPADIASRGCNMEELSASTLWWKGPDFLKQDENNWPQNPITKNTEDNSPANSYAAITKIVQVAEESVLKIPTAASWHKLINATTVIARFIKILAERVTGTPVPTQTACRKLAERWIIKQIQRQTNISEKRINELALYKDEEGLWRMKSRMNNASEIKQDAANPILLSHTRETELLILDIHERLAHGSETSVLTELRQRFVLPKGRAIIKRTIRKGCMQCRWIKSKPFELPNMPNLPADRVNTSGVFKNVGVDYAGPFMVKLKEDDKESKLKAYICLFTCMATRAIHLEVVHSASAASFICALRNFCARRGGPPRTMTSDNGGQFKAAAAMVTLKRFEEDEEITEFTTKNGIRWNFITERAPWKGGFYERMIGLTKRALKAAIGRRQISYEKFTTYVTETETIVNKRPLMQVTADTTERILRPIDFITPYSRTQLPSCEIDDNDDDDPTFTLKQTTATTIEELWNQLNRNLVKFWIFWKTAYLTELRDKQEHQHRLQRSRVKRSPYVNEVVIIEDMDKPKIEWTMGRIVEITTSADGKIRTAKIKTTKGTMLNRAVNHIYPLEIDSCGPEDCCRAIDNFTTDNTGRNDAHTESTPTDGP